MIAQTLAVAALALRAFAQDSTTTPKPAGPAETTISVLVGTLTSGFAGSIVSASGCDTTVALHCTDESIPLCSAAPDVTVTVTQGPTSYRILYSTSSQGVAASVSESCDLAGPSGSFTQAVCTGTLSISGPGLQTAKSTKTTITNTDQFNYAPIPVTAGVEKLASGSCAARETSTSSPTGSTGSAASPASSGASSTSSGSGAAATGISEVYKVIVPIGVAMVGALI